MGLIILGLFAWAYYEFEIKLSSTTKAKDIWFYKEHKRWTPSVYKPD